MVSLGGPVRLPISSEQVFNLQNNIVVLGIEAFFFFFFFPFFLIKESYFERNCGMKLGACSEVYSLYLERKPAKPQLWAHKDEFSLRRGFFVHCLR